MLLAISEVTSVSFLYHYFVLFIPYYIYLEISNINELNMSFFFPKKKDNRIEEKRKEVIWYIKKINIFKMYY